MRRRAESGAIPWLVEEGCGALVLPGDGTALSEALGALAGDAALRKQMGERAFRRSLRLPTWQETGREFCGARDEPSRRGRSLQGTALSADDGELVRPHADVDGSERRLEGRRRIAHWANRRRRDGSNLDLSSGLVVVANAIA